MPFDRLVVKTVHHCIITSEAYSFKLYCIARGTETHVRVVHYTECQCCVLQQEVAAAAV